MLHVYLSLLLLLVMSKEENILFFSRKRAVWVKNQSSGYFLKQAYCSIIFMHMNICRIDWPFPFFFCLCARAHHYFITRRLDWCKCWTLFFRRSYHCTRNNRSRRKDVLIFFSIISISICIIKSSGNPVININNITEVDNSDSESYQLCDRNIFLISNQSLFEVKYEEIRLKRIFLYWII